MRKKRDLLISSGKIDQEDLGWNIAFWQSVSTEERFRATCDLVRAAFELKHKKQLSFSVDKARVVTGAYPND